MSRSSLLRFAHGLIDERLKQGDIAVDATVGNGYDSAFLAELVGRSGRVYGFDVQSDAIKRAGQRLRDAGLNDRVVLFTAGHEHMHDVLPPDVVGCVGGD